jgi:hypothetical protein
MITSISNEDSVGLNFKGKLLYVTVFEEEE